MSRLGRTGAPLPSAPSAHLVCQVAESGRFERLRSFTGLTRGVDFSMGNGYEQATSPILPTKPKMLILPTGQAVPRWHRKLASHGYCGRKLLLRDGPTRSIRRPPVASNATVIA